jgi:transcriptional regulator with XRE-family HTH domain
MEKTDGRAKFGERLQAAIDGRPATQAEVARGIGVHQSAVSQWCRGTSDITLTKAVELASWLGVSLDWLVGLTDERADAFSARDRAVASIARLMDREGAEEVWKRLAPQPAPEASPVPAPAPVPIAAPRPRNNQETFLKALHDGRAKAEARAKAAKRKEA